MEVIAVSIFVDTSFSVRDRNAEMRSIIIEKLHASAIEEGKGHFTTCNTHVHTDFAVRHYLSPVLATYHPNQS